MSKLTCRTHVGILTRLLVISCSLIVLVAAQDKGRESKSVLFVYGGWEGHEPEKCRDLFVPWLKDEGFTVTASPSLDSYLDEDLMNSVDLIIQVLSLIHI